MEKDILVGLLEDDVFARNWMALLLVRDWRTRLVGEFSTQAELFAFIADSRQSIDVLIVDVDQLGEQFPMRGFCDALAEKSSKTKILLIGVQPEPRLLGQLGCNNVAGYALKREMGYSLSWVITFVADGRFVLTPSTRALAHSANFLLPPETLVLDGRKALPGFTDHEAEVARIAFIFSAGRRELADELKISEQWSYGLVSELYKKMGLTDIIAGEVDLFSYIGESEIIKQKFTEIIEELGSSKKAKDMETLAYHVLTMPEIIP